MSYFLSCLRLTLLNRMCSVRNWILMLLLPAMVLTANLMLPKENHAAPVCVGVVLPESGGEEMWQLLEKRSDEVLSFLLTDGETLDRGIAAGQWDCGIILAQDFDQKVSQLDTDRIFILRIGPGSTVYPLVKETVSSCVAQLIGPDIARDYLRDIGIPYSRIQPEEPDRVLIAMSTLDGQPLPVPELTTRGTRIFLRWLICVSILVRMLFGTADLSKWIHRPGMKRTLPLRSPLCSMAARGTADATFMFLSASAALLLLGDGFQSIAAALGYISFWLMVSLLLAQVPKIATALHVFIPFGVVISLLLSNVLMDISLIFPMVSPLSRLLPATMFLSICNGNPAELIFLCIGGFLFLMLAWGVSLYPWKK